MTERVVEEQEMDVPADIPLAKAKTAEDSPVIQPGVETASKEYVDVRLNALSNLIKTSMDPAITLMPISKRKEITAAFDEFEALIATDKE